MTRADLPMLAQWLASAEVAAWWEGPDRQIALVTEDLDHPAMTQVIVMWGDQPIAYAQYYPAQAWPAPHFAHLPGNAIAIDVFAGPAGRGHGGGWLRALGDLLLQQASTLAIDPDPENIRAIRAYEKAGFSGSEIRIDGEGHPVRVLTRLR
ncbi:MAG: GNAT family N-acetyltransferase [Paracoccus sp. (in: a-proteobacteria)]